VIASKTDRLPRILRRGARSESPHVDTLIAGGGPAGLTCAIYLARYRRNVIVVDGMESRAPIP
jgi:thioredoxin reductase (NADPH)